MPFFYSLNVANMDIFQTFSSTEKKNNSVFYGEVNSAALVGVEKYCSSHGA